jgi:hypothetical protein
LIAGFVVLIKRLDTGKWADSSPAAIGDRTCCHNETAIAGKSSSIKKGGAYELH